MAIIFFLIGVSVCVALAFLGMFLWNVRSGQYEDTVTPAERMLFDDVEIKTVLPKQKSE